MKRLFEQPGVLFGLVGLLSVLGCPTDDGPGPQLSSESHFLLSCVTDADCGEQGYDCLCGVCTLDCSGDDACQVLPDTSIAAVCRECVSDGEARSICDVPCSGEADCQGLAQENGAEDLICRESVCREGEVAVLDDPGEADIGLDALDERDGSDGSDRGGDQSGDGLDGSDLGTVGIGEPCLRLDNTPRTIHYVCDCGDGSDPDCVSGDDDGAGTDPRQPWRTVARARTGFADLEAGDGILFCRGGVIDGSGEGSFSSAGCGDEYCWLGDYVPPWADGGEGPPLLTTATANALLSLSSDGVPADAGRLAVSCLALRSEGGGQGVRIGSGLANVRLDQLDVDGFESGVEAVMGGVPSLWSLLGSVVHDNSGAGVTGECVGCRVEQVRFEHNAGGHIALEGSFDGGLIRHNTLRSARPREGRCDRPAIALHGDGTAPFVSANWIEETIGDAAPGCAGIVAGPRPGAGDALEIGIKNNDIINVGALGIGLDAVADSLVIGNVVIGEQAVETTAISVPNQGRADGDGALRSVRIANNSILLSPPQGGVGIRLGGEGSDHILVSNALALMGDGDWTCFDRDGLAADAYASIGYNLCFAPTADSVAWMSDEAVLDTWRSETGWDASSVTVDPGYTEPDGPDYDLAPASELAGVVDRGHSSLSVLDDKTGFIRHDVPDIGAFEWRRPCYDLGEIARTVHYVCDCQEGADDDCVPGDDDDTGATPDAPWQSWGQALTAFGSLAANDAVLFCQGGAFTAGGAGTWFNAQCESASCVVADYLAPWGSGDERAPLLRGRGDDAIIEFSAVPLPSHDEAVEVACLHFLGAAGRGSAVQVNDGVEQIHLRHLTVEGFEDGVAIVGTATNTGFALTDSSVRDNTGFGLRGQCVDCRIVDNQFGFNAAGHIAFSSATSGLVAGNYLESPRSGASTRCTGPSIALSGPAEGLRIEGNLVVETVDAADIGCPAVTLGPGPGGSDALSNVRVAGNTVVNAGRVGIGIDACADCDIENNTIVQEAEVEFIAVAAPYLGREDGEGELTRVALRNNTIVIESSVGGTALVLGGEGTGNERCSNAIALTGAGDWACFDSDGLEPGGFAASDHNLCYAPGADSVTWMDSLSLGDWRIASGFDLGSLTSDPQLTSRLPPSYSVGPASPASPLVDGGDPDCSALTDRLGEPRGESPDIGAVELSE